MFTSLLANSRHWIVSWDRWSQCLFFYFILLRPILLLFLYLLRSSFTTKILYALSFPQLGTFRTIPTIFCIITVVIFGKECLYIMKFLSVCRFLHPGVTFCLLGRNNLNRTIFLRFQNTCFSRCEASNVKTYQTQ